MKLITKDLFEASFYLTCGASLERVFGSDKTVLFQFDGGDDLTTLKSRYDLGSAAVNVQTFRKNLNHLRDKVFERLREQQGKALMHV
jgi:hypothetical protein